MAWRRLLALQVLVLPLVAGACAPPVGAVRVDPRSVHRELTGNVLSTGELSRSTRNVLFLLGLSERFEDDPEAALDTIRSHILAGRSGPNAFPAAAELSFHHAEPPRSSRSPLGKLWGLQPGGGRWVPPAIKRVQ